MKNSQKKFQLLVAALCFISAAAFAQYSPDESKMLAKANAYHDKHKYDKAIELVVKVQNTHMYDENLWATRCIYEQDRYADQFLKDLIFVLKKAGANKNTSNMKFKSTEYHDDMVLACFLATRLGCHQDLASRILHNQYYNANYDSIVPDDAKSEYDKGIDRYNSQDYDGAIVNFKKALDIDSNYFAACDKIVDHYMGQGEFEKAIPFIQKQIRIQPLVLDPHRELANCYMRLKKWNDAYNACVDGIINYPDDYYFMTLDTVAEKMGKTFNRHWMSRDYWPNMLNTTQDPVADEPWSYYRAAKDKMSDYCTQGGVIVDDQSMTQQKYLEVFSWENMLKKSDANTGEFEFARKMMDAGYLDCFCLVSLYHITFNKQYDDFAKKNADKIRTYIGTYLMK